MRPAIHSRYLQITDAPVVRVSSARPSKHVSISAVEEALTGNGSAAQMLRDPPLSAACPTGPDAVNRGQVTDVRRGPAAGKSDSNTMLVVAQGGTGGPIASEADATSWLDQESIVCHAMESLHERVHLEPVTVAEFRNASRPLRELVRQQTSSYRMGNLRV